MAQVTQFPRCRGGEANSGSGAVASLVAMADYMLCQQPQRVTEAIQCLLATLTLAPPPRIEARVRLQLGLTLYHHSNNLLEARQSLEQAMLSSKNISGMEEVRFEAASVLSRIHMEQGFGSNAKKVLRSVLEGSHRFPYWHCRLLLLKANIYASERDFDSLVATLTQTADYAHHVHAPSTRILCLLSKGANLLINKQFQEAASTLSESCTLMDQYTGPSTTLLRTFYMIIQVTHLLGAGLVKTAKPHLKQLQHCVKQLSSEVTEPVDPHSLNGESFEWLTKEQTYVLVYLVCIMHSVQAGSIDKALNYTSKAIELIQRNQDGNPVMTVFQGHLLENIVMCLLMQGKSTLAGSTLQEVIGVCQGHSGLVYSHRAVLHALLGLYAFSTGCLDNSVTQFLTALQHTNSPDLKIFININLVICYMKQDQDRSREIQAIMDNFEPDNQSPAHSKSIKGALSFLQGLYACDQIKLHEAKRHLRETLTIANSNDLNKLTVCSLLLLGRIFLSLGNLKETQDMVGPAFQLSAKIQDRRLQLWATALSIELHHANGDVEEERKAGERLERLKEELHKESEMSFQSVHHKLIQWTVGDWPVSRQPHPLPNEGAGSDDHSEHKATKPKLDTTLSHPLKGMSSGRGPVNVSDTPTTIDSAHHKKRNRVDDSGRHSNNDSEKTMRLGNHDDDITDESIPPKSHSPVKANIPTPQLHSDHTHQLHSDHTHQLHSDHTHQLHSDHTHQLQGASGYTHQLPSSHTPQLRSDHTPQRSTPSGYTPQIPSGHTPQAPSGHTPQIISGHTPQISSGHTPQSPSRHTPQTPSGHTPQISSGHTPQSPSRHTPQAPSGHTPQISSGHTPQIPSGHTPQAPSGHISSGNTPLDKQLELDPLLKDQAPSQATPTLPTYNESMQAPPTTTEHVSPPTQPSPAHAYHKRYQENMQRLERLKQQQVYYHQSGATQQQWYQLQAQHQFLLQQQNQIQQWIMKERRDEQLRQMELEKKREDERRERIIMLENRRRAEEGERGRERGGWMPVSDSAGGHAQLARQQDQGSSHPHGYNQQSLLWKPITQTTMSPQYQSFHPTPPLSQSPPTNPFPHAPLNRQSPNLTSLMKTTPPTHPEVRSRYATPSSSGHTHMGTPPRPQSGLAGISSPQTRLPITPRQAEDPLNSPAHRPHPQLMMLQTPNAYQLPSNQSVPEFINETEAILRQQEYQRLVQQQQLMQQQLRQNQDPAARSFILQQGMVPMAIPQTSYVQQFENPNVGVARSLAQTGHPTAAMVMQQGHAPNVYPPTQSAVIHPGGNTTKNLSYQQQMKFQ